jgi:hypothetical protein
MAVVVLPRTDTFEPVCEKGWCVLRRATDEQVNVIGLYSEVENFEALVAGYFVEDGSHTVCDLALRVPSCGTSAPTLCGS